MRSKEYKYNLLFVLVFLFGCTQMKMAKLVKEMENNPPDFSFIVQPEYKTSKEALEVKVKELFIAEEVKIGAAGIGGVIGSPTQKEDSRYWLQTVLLNPAIIFGFNHDTVLTKTGAEIGQLVTDGITNIDKYDKIQITFMHQYQEGAYWKTFKYNKYYRIPSLEATELSDE